MSWAAGNLFLRETRAAPSCRVTAWASLIPPLPLLAIGVLHDGWAPTLAPILEPTWRGWFVLFYTVVPVMWLGYLLWGTLLRTYPAGKVGPVSLLVPCCALVFSALLTGESVGGLRLAGCGGRAGRGGARHLRFRAGGAEKENGGFRPRFPPNEAVRSGQAGTSELQSRCG